MNSSGIQDLSAVVFQFFKALDTREHEVVAGLIATNGVWVRQGKELAGREQVLAALQQRDPARRTAHLITNLWIVESTAMSARIHYYVTAYEHASARDDHPTSLHIAGVLDSTDELVLENGQWRIQRKTSQRLLPPA